MANKKITDLTAATTVAATDLFEVVTDVGGTPTSKKVAASTMAIDNATGKIALARGGTNADLSASGAATHVLAQAADHSISARALVVADLPIAYAVGTWTPILAGSASGVKTAAAGNYGWYVKIGRIVFVGGTLSWNGGDTLAGTIKINGLPFTCTSTSGARSAGIPGVVSAGSITVDSGYYTLALNIDPTADYIWVYEASATAFSNPGIGASGNIYGFYCAYEID